MSSEIFNSRKEEYKDKFGAVTNGTEVCFTLNVPQDMNESYVGAVIVRDGYEDFHVCMRYECGFDGARVYKGRYIFDTVGIAHYFFKIIDGSAEKFVVPGHSGSGVLSDKVESMFQQTVYDKEYKTPDRFKGGIMYQIFPDRFFKSGRKIENTFPDRFLRSDWGGMPNFLPDEQGRVLNNDYFCGDLEGIRLKLPYLKKLGVDCIYLNPIFEAHSNHRYNTADYMKIDPLLGTEEDFKKLCDSAHENKIKIILDGVFSHTGSDSVYFNMNRRYESVGAYNSPESPYYSWYKFYDYPNGYQSWWGFTTLPETNEEDEGYYEFICGENGVVKKWLSLGADGFRLDVADELPNSMIDGIRTAVKADNSGNILIGEVWEDASNKESYGIKRRYLLGRQLDSVMNYPFKDAVLDYIRFCNKQVFEQRIMTIVENYPKCSLDVMMNSISTHDTERAITKLAGDLCENHGREWQSHHSLTIEQYELGKKRLKLAMVLQYFLPGIPCVYYGDETGMQGYKDPFNRGCFNWNNEDQDILSHAVELGRIRKSKSVLAEGNFRFIDTGNELLAFERYSGQSKKRRDSVCVVVNPTDHKAEWNNYVLEAYSYKII